MGWVASCSQLCEVSHFKTRKDSYNLVDTSAKYWFVCLLVSFVVLFCLFLKDNVINIRSIIFKCLCHWNIQIKQISVYFNFFPEKICLCNCLVYYNISQAFILCCLKEFICSVLSNQGFDSIFSFFFFFSYEGLVKKKEREYSVCLPI